MYVQLSNRDEWDLGPDPNFKSYGHFYTDAMDPTPVRVEDDTRYEGMQTVYGWDYALIRTAPPNKYAAWGVEPDADPDTYDVAQLISENARWVGWAAFWPSQRLEHPRRHRQPILEEYDSCRSSHHGSHNRALQITLHDR
jgi:hypothetical protein